MSKPATSAFKKPRPIPAADTLKGISTGRAEIYKLDPRTIQREPGFNTRTDFGDIAALAEDIAANGVLEPLKVRKDGEKILLVNGDRRLTAIKSLLDANRWPEDPVNKGYPMPVPCASEPRNVKPLDRIFMMLSLNTGKPFNMLEKGAAYLRILATDPAINASEIARRSGETKQAVSNALALVRDGAPELIDLVRSGTIAATTALEILKNAPDHADQMAAAAAAIASATTNGRHHATPKDLKQKPAPPPVADSTWNYTPSTNFAWNEHKVATAPTTITLSKPKAPFVQIQLRVARSAPLAWRAAYSYNSNGCSTAGGGGLPNKGDTEVYPDESSAVTAAWRSLAPKLVSVAEKAKDPSAMLAWLTTAGQSLHARFVTGTDHDDSLFIPDPTRNAYIAEGDGEDEDDDDSKTDPSDPSDPSAKSDAPADSSAFDRLRNAPTTHRDGSGTNSAGPGFAAPDKLLKALEKLMDDLDSEVVSPKKWGTAEVILDYLSGNHPISTVRDFLIS